MYYSYDSCGNAPDCYSDFSDARCPYDPHGNKSYMIHKAHGCECIYHGSELPADIYNNYPSNAPGKYASLSAIRIYGTTCAAWDQVPETPWESFCPVGVDWCSSSYNWCQVPWCYVADTCESKVESSVFRGATVVYYSYDTCMSAPDCYNAPYSAACPFDSKDISWATGADCPDSWSDVCECLFQGVKLPRELAAQYPAKENVDIYGSSCAAWDKVPGTPLNESCPQGADWSSATYNWCQLPFCYVSSSCPSRIKSSVFENQEIYYSYDTCGNAPDCYNAFDHDPRCPYDPHGTKTYMTEKVGDGCYCIFQGRELPEQIYTYYPAEDPGKYRDLSKVKVYGTTCAAWDQIQDTPLANHCPLGVDWCHSDNNWCQVPWCYVGNMCESKRESRVFNGARLVYYSYDTCLSAPDCYNNPRDPACPFDHIDTQWPTAEVCPDSWTDVCECIYQGQALPKRLYTEFPSQEPGKYATLSHIALYGTSCAAWDQVPGTPFESSCPPGSVWSSKEYNWCQIPWCYVGKTCASKIPTALFNGAEAYYSYDSCGHAPDCYNNFNEMYGETRCPYDPHGKGTYKIHKGDGCECVLQGLELPLVMYKMYPTSDPGAYENLSAIKIYGSTCAAWDQMPGTPWADHCPHGVDWCSSAYNWCQLPWCYVSGDCATGTPSGVFAGIDADVAHGATHYSYDTCLSTPDCYNNPASPGCPYDSSFTGLYTAEVCPQNWTDVCECTYQGSLLPENLYKHYPLSEPGKYANMTNIIVYGTSCAAWDQVPNTPWAAEMCPRDSDWSDKDYNWCQIPWCYVSKSCPTRIPSSVFAGSETAFYSYDTCGNSPDCYTNYDGDSRCPFDPYGTKSYMLHKGERCDCMYHGQELPSSVYRDYPKNDPGKYANYSAVRLYGTTCAAWDQMPGTPGVDLYCPADSEWCSSEYNFCQLPWCYVGNGCKNKRVSSVFSGSVMVFFSYDTCLSTPNCATPPFEAQCPFDSRATGWITKTECVDSWTDVCACKYQGQVLPADIYENFPEQFPGKYKHYKHVSMYGTSCAAWDSIPYTPFSEFCPPGQDWSSPESNWCQLPWCYVNEECPTAIASSVFAGDTTAAFYSYDSCGNAPDCYNHFHDEPHKRCPWDPYSTKKYKIHKGDGCECLFQGLELPGELYMNYPWESPGKYKDKHNIRAYGTTCAAWDQIPGTPLDSYCPTHLDWCQYDNNWCQLPWCYVGEACTTKQNSSVFNGSWNMWYSYDTCLSSPNCKADPPDPSCPFDNKNNAWSTASECPAPPVGWSDKCECQYQGQVLPEHLYRGKSVENLSSISVYGTSCAAWDQIPNTPLSNSCPPGSDWSNQSFNWCQAPWCYVNSSCVWKIPSAIMSEGTFYSYEVCGKTPDCYNNWDRDERCPYDPTGGKSYMTHKGNGCQCKYHGKELPAGVYIDYPYADPGKYANFSLIQIYGTSCAAWDQIPGTPWVSFCPLEADWCHTSANWCQLPWCYVDSDCATGVATEVFNGSNLTFYSYDTCLSTPDCYNAPYDAACPYDGTSNNWSTDYLCPNSWSDVCSCIYQGTTLPVDLYIQSPAEEPGLYATLDNIRIYGTTCAAWDQVPGTPLADRCPQESEWSSKESNWCQLPWCYVSPACPTGVSSSVFVDTTMHYSYDSCGNAPDCYRNFDDDFRCPYDPNKEETFVLHKGDGCECKFQGGSLPDSLLLFWPRNGRGQYRNLPNINSYGTTCAAWDQIPQTPLASHCPVGLDWCHSDQNWCQLPWCYVSNECKTRKSSLWGKGSPAEFYSYDTCLSTPDCRATPFDPRCPFDEQDTAWSTASTCQDGWSDVCSCKYQGTLLPEALRRNFPSSEPGKYFNLTNLNIYGTTCAAWDSLPNTPFADKCLPGSDWSTREFNWCQLPWCYVNDDCVTKEFSNVFEGSSSVYFSYDACGNAPDCYAAFDFNSKCPYDPYGDKTYTVFKADGCECLFHGAELPPEIYKKYPFDEPGMYENLSAIRSYGTTCAAWDQVPGTPWSSYCPVGADWCHSSMNWCQIPWCYVSDRCGTKIPSSVFNGSDIAFYSYDTCHSAPDCFGNMSDVRCPFDSSDAGWSTAKDCPDSWSNVCDCIFQGTTLPWWLLEQYPTQEPGKYKHLKNAAVYGTFCAAWDQVPKTPRSDWCPEGYDWSSSDYNWCQLPWCYVSSACVTAVPSSVFNGSTTAYYSYDSCGNAPDCYHNFELEGARCPYDPFGEQTYKAHKSDDGCECVYHGRELPFELLLNYPVSDPGKYLNMTYASIYGTSCAAWDQMPHSPNADYCPPGSQWCTTEKNWCQVPWCYVSSKCESKIETSVFDGSDATFYSYDTCLNAPDCYNQPYDSRCPFDHVDTGWSTASSCEYDWADVCDCIYQGSTLPDELLDNFPWRQPGLHKTQKNIAIYGTACAAWDHVPDTPLAQSCPPAQDYSSADFNWCQLPWCYVSSACVTKIKSTVFDAPANSPLTNWYSYDTCGNAPDCYPRGTDAANFYENPRCPYDPHGTKTYTTHKGDGCECLYQGLTLTNFLINNYPAQEPGKYKDYSHIKVYGTTCAAWDQIPGTPWAEYCPVGLDWCHSTNNWCQLPWCYVGENCATKRPTEVWNGSSTTFYSYDTCLSTPDCYNQPFEGACPFDSEDTSWATASVCPAGFSDVCECLYQGREIPREFFMGYDFSPTEEELANMTLAPIYGSVCAPWDQMPNQFFNGCPPGSDWKNPSHNWCQLPWCWVSEACPSRIRASGFDQENGSDSPLGWYSYDTCANAPDCYTAFDTDVRCPYDPTRTMTYSLYKGGGCECIYNSEMLPRNVYTDYPLSDPGKYASLKYIAYYGTSCTAWDALPFMPFSGSCKEGSDWCSTENNWCQLPWCYVGESCDTKIKSEVFEGVEMYYSYDTCISTPDCYHAPFDPRCPFDSKDSGWSTSTDCVDGWSDVCECIHQGQLLPQDLIQNYPTSWPGKWKLFDNVGIYGTSCAAWDQVPGTPNSLHCHEEGADFSSIDYNWCQVPWCYVSKDCPSAIKSSVFEGSDTTFYSYDTCGNGPDCYTSFDDPHGRCPYDPYGTKSYVLHKGDGCECKFHGGELPEQVYTYYPRDDMGKYANLSYTKIYGTSCAAWDQIPDTPFASFCPVGVDWCESTYNWCQLPWCYVEKECATATPTSVWLGADHVAGHYSYDTCLGTPDCYNWKYDATCPFDPKDNAWSTPAYCPDGWSDRAGVPITTFESGFELQDVWSFSADSYAESVANSTGASPEQVIVEKVEFQVSVSYSLDGAVTEAAAREFVAKGAGVDESQVTVTIKDGDSRRLGRRLATSTVDAVISTEDVVAVQSITEKASDPSRIQTALSVQGLSVTVAETPKTAVIVSTKIRGTDPMLPPVVAPSPDKLSTALGSTFGFAVSANVMNEVIKTPPTSTTVTTTSSSTSTHTSTSSTSTSSSSTSTTMTSVTKTTTTVVIDFRIRLGDKDYYSTRTEAEIVGTKFCDPIITTTTSTTTTTTLQPVGASWNEKEVSFQLCYDFFAEEPIESIDCAWALEDSPVWTPFGGKSVCSQGLCKCSAWKKQEGDSHKYKIKLVMGGQTHHTTETLAMDEGPKTCLTKSTTSTMTATTVTSTLDSIGMTLVLGEAYYHTCSDYDGPVFCDWQRQGEFHWYAIEGYGTCYKRKCSCPAIAEAVFRDAVVPDPTETETTVTQTSITSTTLTSMTSTTTTTVPPPVITSGATSTKAFGSISLALLLFAINEVGR
eukprot:TRINITY_DN5832_c0_g1_i1.p1 TRINITY_DN5832_c0_g1~~TRINITY_DN5832_c0_g1_i1.p1  ORF type:complete len:3749 (+),score=493.44 TRINITY_DN5832_c0_g1_i1:111-11249(+)